MCYLIIKFVFSKLQCCYLYKKTQHNLDSFLKLKCNLHSTSTDGAQSAHLGRPWGLPYRYSSNHVHHMSIQLREITSVTQCIWMCEVSDPPRDASTVAMWRPRKLSVSVPTVMSNAQIDSYPVDCEIIPRTLY